MSGELPRPDRLPLTPSTDEQRRAAARYIQRNARDADDQADLLDKFGLTDTPQPAPAKRASVPATTTADCPINTRKDGQQ